MPNLVAYDLAGVQPMSGPTGLIFAMRAKYNDQNGDETFYDEVLTGQSGADGVNPGATVANTGDNPAVLNDVFDDNEATRQARYTTGAGMGTDVAEGLDSDGSDPDFREMGFGIEKVSVTAKSRALKASYSLETLHKTCVLFTVLMLSQNWQTSFLLRSLLRSTEKLSELFTSLLLVVLKLTLQTKESLTWTLTPTDVGLLRSSRVLCSKLSVTQT